LGVDLSNLKQQELFGRLDSLFNPQDAHLLMNWIVMDNLPFCIIKSERFRRFLGAVNSKAWIPIKQMIMKFIAKEFLYVVPYIKQILQLARNMIYLTFDGWIFRQNDSYLKIIAHFVDNLWRH
jgi:hypothetical protein